MNYIQINAFSASLIGFHYLAIDASFQMTTVETGAMRLVVFTPALIISSDVPVADVSQAIGPVMVTTTVETSVMNPKSIVPKKRFVLLLVVM